MAVAIHEKKPISIDELKFDVNNPRLVGEHLRHDATDFLIIQKMAESADIAELIISIVENTFVDFEPIVVIPDGDLYRVLEGNRRLAAIKLINDENLAASLAQDLKLRISQPVSDSVLESIQNIPSIVVKQEADAQSYIGFKHINGPHKWTSFAKAKFVTKWFKEGSKIEVIAKKVGDKNQTVKDLISGMLVLEQAENEEIFDISDRTKRGVFGFSHLYTALNRKEYRDYLGLDKEWTETLSENPIKHSKIEHLENVMKYMYGSKKDNIDSVIGSQNPHLKQLGAVFKNPIATQMLIETNNLQTALEETEEKSAVFEKYLISANTQLQKASANVSSFDGSETILEMAHSMHKKLEMVITNMESVK